MEPLDFRQFVWVRGAELYNVLAITSFRDLDIVVYQNANIPHEIKVLEISDFCMEFTPTYELI